MCKISKIYFSWPKSQICGMCRINQIYSFLMCLMEKGFARFKKLGTFKHARLDPQLDLQLQ